MRSLLLDPGAPTTGVDDVVKRMLAIQGQEFAASRWAIGCRSPGAVDADVIAAYDAGRIVRSWPMRGTVHVVCAQDLPWLLELTGVRALSPTVLAGRWQRLGLTRAILERAREAAVAFLSGGRRATRPELAAAMGEAGLAVAGELMYHVTWYLAHTGTLVQGPLIGNRHALVLMDEWISQPRRLSREAALVELVVRYLGAHGPATLEDMAWWSGLTKTDLRAGVAAAGAALETAVHAGTGDTLLMRSGTLDRHDPGSRPRARATVALAAFDEHLLGYRFRGDVLDPTHAGPINAGLNGMFPATIVRGGRVVGTWRVTRRATGVSVLVEPLIALSATARRDVERALARWSRFAGAPILETAFAG